MILGSSTLCVKAEPGFRDLYRKQDLYRAALADNLVANLCIVTKASRARQACWTCPAGGGGGTRSIPVSNKEGRSSL